MRISILAMTAALVVAGAGLVSAQTGVTVSASSEAVGFHYLGAWSAGDFSTQSVDVIDWGAQKGNSLSAEADEFLAPTPGFNSYLAVMKIAPDISGLISRTNLTADQFHIFARAGGGETVLGSAAKGTIMAGGGASWTATPNLTVNMADAYWLHFNNQNTFALSAGLQYIFNPEASPAAAVQRMIRRRALIRASTATAK